MRTAMERQLFLLANFYTINQIDCVTVKSVIAQSKNSESFLLQSNVWVKQPWTMFLCLKQTDEETAAESIHFIGLFIDLFKSL